MRSKLTPQRSARCGSMHMYQLWVETAGPWASWQARERPCLKREGMMSLRMTPEVVLHLSQTCTHICACTPQQIVGADSHTWIKPSTTPASRKGVLLGWRDYSVGKVRIWVQIPSTTWTAEQISACLLQCWGGCLGLGISSRRNYGLQTQWRTHSQNMRWRVMEEDTTATF